MIRRLFAALLRLPTLLPNPRRQPMVTCPYPDCGRPNDPDRGSKNCWYCARPLAGSARQHSIHGSR